MVSCNKMHFILVNLCCRTCSEMPWPYRFFSLPGTCYSGKGQFYQGTANVTASGIPCQKWSDQVSVSVRCTKWRAVLEVCLSKEFLRVRQTSLSERVEQEASCLHSWAHFIISSYFNLQVLLTVSRCVLCHFRRPKGCFTKGSVLLPSFGFSFNFVLIMTAWKIMLKHRYNLLPSPRLPICTGGLLRFSQSYLMLRITAAIQEVRMSVPGATRRIQLWPGNTAVCLPVEMVGNCTLWFLPLWLLRGHARCLHPGYSNLFCPLDSAGSGSSHRFIQDL